jgi:hypothetical protein
MSIEISLAVERRFEVGLCDFPRQLQLRRNSDAAICHDRSDRFPITLERYGRERLCRIDLGRYVSKLGGKARGDSE